MPYLICDRCNGYYKLHKGESIQDFLSCNCGGNLVYVEELRDITDENRSSQHQNLPDEKTSKAEDYSERGGGRKTKYGFYIMVVLILLISVTAAASFTKLFNSTSNTTKDKPYQLGSNSLGYVDKYVYNGSEHSNLSGKKIAVITGIHPREKLSKAVWMDLLKKYAVPEGFQITEYDINVVDKPNDFISGRANGESLAATFILPEISKSQYDLIIVCHDHEPGYGEGFFIATPRMDSKSVSFAEALTQKLTTFDYYKNNNNNTNEGTSNIHFTNYLVEDGYRTIVYEMPGLSSYDDAYSRTSLLLDDSIETLDGN